MLNPFHLHRGYFKIALLGHNFMFGINPGLGADVALKLASRKIGLKLDGQKLVSDVLC